MYEAFLKNAFSLVYFSKQRFSSLFALKLNRKGGKKNNRKKLTLSNPPYTFCHFPSINSVLGLRRSWLPELSFTYCAEAWPPLQLVKFID